MNNSTLKMWNKKSMGLRWYFLLIPLFISIGILYYSIASIDIPKVGEISLEMIKTLEKNSLIPSIIERVTNWINERTIKDLDENKIFKLRSYCGSEEYKTKIDSSKQTLNGGFEALEGKTSNCIIAEKELKQYFEIIFEGEYNDFRKKDLSQTNLDLSKTTYTSLVDGKNNEYFNIVNTSNGIDIPINIEKKQIGKFTTKPVFKIPVDYAFDDKEVCILSVDCTADCDDVIARYSEIEFRKKANSCNEYFFCADAFPDDFGLKYPCNANFCMETGVDASCSNAADDTVCPDCCCTPWVVGECIGNDREFNRECKLDGCDDIKKLEYDSCCADPICCENYPPACDCGGNICCTEDDNLCPPNPEPIPTPPPSG